VPESPLDHHQSTPEELRVRLQAARTGVPFLVYRDADDAQVVAPLDPRRATRMSIGRRPENDIAIPWDDLVSRLHAELEHVGGEWVISDDGLSTNGTWVGEVRLVGRRRLHDGDVLRIGSTPLAFCAPAGAPSRTRVGQGDEEATGVQISAAQRRVLVALCRPLLSGERYGPPPGNAQIAEALFLSVNSVKTHLKALVMAFGLDTAPQAEKRAALVARAIQLGVVTERDLD
jgi:hypothetical protein